MIIGIGNDMVGIARFERLLTEYGEKFLDRIFTPAERAKAASRDPSVATLAKRFAAKEACAKALGTGIAAGVNFKDMGVVNLPTGQPTLELTGGALARLQALTPAGMVARIHLALTDEPPYALAQVVIEALDGGASA